MKCDKHNVVLSVLPRLKQMNPNIYEAALDLGATPMQALRKVIIPEIRPGIDVYKRQEDSDSSVGSIRYIW